MEGLWPAIIGALSGVISSVILYLTTIKKNDADAASAIAEASAVLIAPLREQIRLLSEENARINGEIIGLQSQLSDWQDWARRLEDQIRSLGHEPIQRSMKKK